MKKVKILILEKMRKLAKMRKIKIWYLDGVQETIIILPTGHTAITYKGEQNVRKKI